MERKLASGEDEDAIVRWVSERILESFKNGCAAGKADKPSRKPKGTPAPEQAAGR